MLGERGRNSLNRTEEISRFHTPAIADNYEHGDSTA